MSPLLSFIICTYNRYELLIEAVESVINQLPSDGQVELVIVNNYIKTTLNPAEFNEESYKWVTIVEEPKVGLSHARNKGLSTVRGQWCGFLDDDAVIPEGFISKALKVIQSADYDCFGGAIESRWRYGRPRWLSAYFGCKPALSNTESIISEGYLWGSNLFMKTEKLLQIGGFPLDVGMKGLRTGYGAETIVQKAFREKGYSIAYIPELIVYHVVDKHKLRMSWHLKAAYATARDGKALFQSDYTLKGWLKSLKTAFSSPAKGWLRLCTDKNYYWENLLIDSLRPWYIMAGKWEAIWSR